MEEAEAALNRSSSEEESPDEEEEEEDDYRNVSGMKVPRSGNKLNAPGPSQGKSNPKPELETDSEEEDSDDDSESDTDGDLARRMRRGAGISTPGSDEDDRTRILSVLELEDLFLKQAPESESLRSLSTAFSNAPAYLRLSQSRSLTVTRRSAWSSVSSDTPTSESHQPSTLSSARRRSPSRQPPERPSTSKPSASPATSSSAIARVSFSPSSRQPRPTSSAMVFFPSTR